MKHKIMLLVLSVLCIFSLTGCGKTMHERKVERAKSQIMEENPSFSEEEAARMAEEQVLEEENIKKRLRAGEKIDGYNGYYVCKDEVKNAPWNSGLVQVGDMVFDERLCMTPDDVRKVVEGSSMGLTVIDTFSNGYKAVEVANAKGDKVLTFFWVTVSEYSNAGGIPVGNYLGLVMPGSNEKQVPWNVDCVYLPGGYSYFYSEVLKMEERPESFRELKREELFSYLNEKGFVEGDLYNFGQAGKYYNYGEEYTTVTFADNARERETRENSGFTDVRQVSRDVKFYWDTEGNCTDVYVSSYKDCWVPENTWYDLE